MLPNRRLPGQEFRSEAEIRSGLDNVLKPLDESIRLLKESPFYHNERLACRADDRHIADVMGDGIRVYRENPVSPENPEPVETLRGVCDTVLRHYQEWDQRLSAGTTSIGYYSSSATSAEQSIRHHNNGTDHGLPDQFRDNVNALKEHLMRHMVRYRLSQNGAAHEKNGANHQL